MSTIHLKFRHNFSIVDDDVQETINSAIKIGFSKIQKKMCKDELHESSTWLKVSEKLLLYPLSSKLFLSVLFIIAFSLNLPQCLDLKCSQFQLLNCFRFRPWERLIKQLRPQYLNN